MWVGSSLRIAEHVYATEHIKVSNLPIATKQVVITVYGKVCTCVAC